MKLLILTLIFSVLTLIRPVEADRYHRDWWPENRVVLIPFAPFYVPPTVYAPPPVIVYPTVPEYIAPQTQYWYYCDNPSGYYPYIQICPTPWRLVPVR